MGLFGGGDDTSPAQDRANQLLDEQITQSRAELEEKRHSLAEQRMAIVKSQGGEQWTPNRNASYADTGGTKPQGKLPRMGGWFNGFSRNQ
jgi:hypothetical protein